MMFGLAQFYFDWLRVQSDFEKLKCVVHPSDGSKRP